MDLSILQLLGSLASVFSIPLAIYLFLRSREARFRRVRQEIARSLSYQIGDARELSQFEIQAVIDSHARENRIRKGKIQYDDIVEDLVTDTIRNPMIPSSRKGEIINNLRNLHMRNASYLQLIAPATPDRDEEQFLEAQERHALPANKNIDGWLTSTVFLTSFVVIGWALTAIIYFFFHGFWVESNNFGAKKETILILSLSAVCSLGALVITAIYRWINLSRPENRVRRKPPIPE